MRITLTNATGRAAGRAAGWAVPPLCACVAAASGCGGGTAPGPSASTLKVVATTTQLTDFARVVAGRRATVYDVVKANVDAHDFEPSPADLEAVRRADIVIQNGLGLETWFDSVIKSAEPKGRIVDASLGAHVLRGDDNPHIWFDPRNAKVMVANIADALAAADPQGAPTYRRNQRVYDNALDALDAEIASAVGTLRNKKLVTNHDAFGYFAARYGLDFVGSVIPSFDTQAELSGADLADLVDEIKRERVKAVFSEAALPSKTAATIASEAGVKVVAGDDALFGDSLGARGSDGDTYLKMQRHNTRVIVENLR